MAIFGCDCAHHQGTINFNQVKTTNIKFVILKATEGVSYKDPCFDQNVKNAIASGLQVGAYHFLRSTPIEQQCNDFLVAIKPYRLTFPVFLDVENPPSSSEISSLGKTEITNRVIYFAKKVRVAGYKDILCYASKSWFGTYIDTNQLRANNIGIWMAAYSSANPSNTDRSNVCDIWQYASDGKVSGINGNVDVDVCYKDFGTGIVSTNDDSFISDTTQNFSLPVGGSYQFKITAKNSPVFSIGTGGVFTHSLVSQSGNDYFYKITAIGKPNDAVGIYVNGKKLCVVSIKEDKVVSDTPSAINVKKGSTYQFKLTAKSKPNFVCGSGGAFAVNYAGNIGNDYFFKITALANVGDKAGFYINGEKSTVVTII